MISLTIRRHRGASARPPVLLAMLAGLASVASLWSVLFLARPADAKPAAKGSPIAEQLLLERPQLVIPETLRPWVGWVLNDKESALCPPETGADEDGVCTWPARLTLSLRDKGGTFGQAFRVYKTDWVPLPGSAALWPQDVRVDGKPWVVVAGGGDDSEDEAPTVLLLPGEHVVTGSFLWDELPESLPIPKKTGLVTLNVSGKPVPSPSREEDGLLYLHKEVQEVAEEVLELRVHRKVTDAIPLFLATQISLRVSGKSREVTLGKALPPEFVPMELSGALPARLEADGRLKVQVRPGTYELTLLARHEGPVNALSRPTPDGQWPTDEIWVFDARPELRVVTVEGVPALDPQQTTLPAEWKSMPAFPMRQGDTLKLREERRGDQNPAPDRLLLSRRLWLDFDGRAFTASDRITGTLTRTWRLEAASPTELGRVGVSGQDQVITRGKSGQAGIELRQGKVQLTADSRIPRVGSELPAVGWAADFAGVKIALNLPPGWRLFYASGADEVPDTVVSSYTLLDLFLVLLVTMAIGRLFGIGWGVIALLAIGLSCTERAAPRWIFLAVLATEALSRVLAVGLLGRLLRWTRLGILVALVVILVGFSATQVRRGLHPALDHGDGELWEKTEEYPDWLKRPQADSDNSGSQREKDEEEKPAAPKLAEAFKRDSAMGGKREEPMGGLVGNEIGDAYGAGGLGLVGSGRGGGGTGEGTIGLGELGTIGRGAGAPASDAKKAKPKEPPAAPAPSPPAPRRHSSVFEIDPNATVQTGPGLPRWQWAQSELGFSGPVKQAQMIHLYLVPPWLTRLLLLGQVGLLALLVLRLCGITRLRPGPRAVAALLLLLGLGLGGPARAETPSDQLLEKLQEQLLKPASCRPNCASIARLQLDATPRQLRLRLEVAVAAASAVPLPGSPEQWLPTQVLVDGKPTNALRLSADHLWLAVATGSHQVVLEGPLPRRDTVQLTLPLKPHRVDSKLKGWQLDGVHEDGLADEALQLSRADAGAGGKEADAADQEAEGEGEGSDAAGLKPSTLPPFVMIERELQLGQKWQVVTRVWRMTPSGSAVVLEVPLLAGESVTTPEVRVQNGKVLVNLGPTVSELSWRSLLQEKPRIELLAAKGSPWSEVWRLSISPIYHVELAGIPVIHQQDGAKLRQPEWRPWPGEQVTIEVTRPEGVPGRTLTIDHSELKLKPGLRATDATLTVELRTSRGGPHPFGLPSGAQLLGVEINGKAQPLQSQDDRLTLNLVPGAQSVVVKFQLAQGILTLYRTPQVDLGVPSVNANVIIELGHDRWLLLAMGPPLGPSVMFWSLLLVVALLAVALGQFGKTPLRTHHYFLLGVGLTQVPVTSAALVIGWLLALGYRQRGPQPAHWLLFNLRQLVLVGWTAAALLLLVEAISRGLVGRPEMQLAGNGSTIERLRWFADRSEGKLPLTTVLSLPLRAYQAAMLAWALWIAQALIGWLRWGYAAFTTDGLMRSRPPRPLPEEPAAPPSASPAPEPAPKASPETNPDTAPKVLPDSSAETPRKALPESSAATPRKALPETTPEAAPETADVPPEPAKS